MKTNAPKSIVRAIRPTVGFVALILLFWSLYKIRVVFIPFFFGFLLAYVLDPVVDYLETLHLHRVLAIILVYIIMGLFIAGLLIYVLPAFFHDLNRLVELIPQQIRVIQDTIREMQLGYDQVAIPEGFRQVLDGIFLDVENMALDLVQGLARGLLLFFSQAFNLILAPVLSFYFLLEFNNLGRHIIQLMPLRFRAEAEQIGMEINQVIKKFIRGNVVVAFLVGFMAAAGMAVIGMEFPLLLGFLVGITNFIPYFGAIISAIPVIFLALLKSKWLALYVTGLMFIIQQVEGNIISPRILGKCVGLHPLVIILALLVGGQLWGVGGMILAIPLAAITKILVKHFYMHLV